jgi:hypothetical protein
VAPIHEHEGAGGYIYSPAAPNRKINLIFHERSIWLKFLILCTMPYNPAKLAAQLVLRNELAAAVATGGQHEFPQRFKTVLPFRVGRLDPLFGRPGKLPTNSLRHKQSKVFKIRPTREGRTDLSLCWRTRAQTQNTCSLLAAGREAALFN